MNPGITIRFCSAIFDACPWVAPATYRLRKQMTEHETYQSTTGQQHENADSVFEDLKKMLFVNKK
jgi:hypothetical protein